MYITLSSYYIIGLTLIDDSLYYYDRALKRKHDVTREILNFAWKIKVIGSLQVDELFATGSYT